MRILAPRPAWLSIFIYKVNLGSARHVAALEEEGLHSKLNSSSSGGDSGGGNSLLAKVEVFSLSARGMLLETQAAHTHKNNRGRLCLDRIMWLLVLGNNYLSRAFQRKMAQTKGRLCVINLIYPSHC